ncbi:MAG: hypothetical protein AAGB48_04050 [Planctomycetota bacterium]
MADQAKSSDPTESAPDSAQPPACGRWLALAGAWLSGLALAALVVSIAAFFVHANRPPEPPATTSITLNGKPISGEDAKDLLVDVGSRLFRTITDRDEDASAETPVEMPDRAAPGASQTDTPMNSGVLEFEMRTNESTAERLYKRFFWVFVAMGLTGAAIGGIAYWQGARSAAVSIAIWPIWFLGALAMAVPSCSG